MSQIVSKGSVLVAHPLMDDLNFTRSVILIVNHDEDGTLGFVLNQGAELTLDQAIESATEPHQISIGGPVSPDHLYFIHCRPDIIQDAQSIDDFLYWGGDYHQMMDAIKSRKLEHGHIRFFVGYSGWGEGQLDEEIKEGAWQVMPCNLVPCLNEDPKLWNDMISQLPQDVQQWRNAPELPELN